MVSTFSKLKQLYEGKDISLADARQITYEELRAYASANMLLSVDPDLSQNQIEDCYHHILKGALITCIEGGIYISASYLNEYIHLSDTFNHQEDVQEIVLSIHGVEIKRIQTDKSGRGIYVGGTSGNNNNNNNNNNS